LLESSIAETSATKDTKKEKPANPMFKATMNDARLFRNLIGAISSLIEEADFNASPDGIKLRSMDPSHIAMVDFEWPKTAFDTYECTAPTKLRLSVSNLLKLLRGRRVTNPSRLSMMMRTRSSTSPSKATSLGNS